MNTPQYSLFEFLNAGGFNAASQAVSGDFAALASGISIPGLIHPDSATATPTALVVNVAAPLPFQILFGSGVLASAHGTVTGQDTQSYAVNFAGVVPASGSVTAYLIASYQQIQQGAYQVVGPPVGHPDYNPNFQPYIAYATLVDSMALSASITPPDNSTTFELGRCTLAAGATGVGAIDPTYQMRRSAFNTTQVIQVSGNTALTGAYAGKVVQVTAPATLTLPPVATSTGQMYGVSALVSGVALQPAAGGIFGAYSASVTGVSSIVLAQGSSVMVHAQDGVWQVMQIGGPVFPPNTLLANPTGLSAIAGPTGLSTMLDTISNALGSLLVRGAGGWSFVSASGVAVGSVLTMGTSGIPAWGASGNGHQLLQVDIITTSETWNKPAGATAFEVWVIGGGGGGDGIGAGGGFGSVGSAGGGAYGFFTSGIGATELVTIGAGGPGGGDSPTVNPGISGGTTSFGAHIAATGGSRGSGGGIGSGGSLRVQGGTGGYNFGIGGCAPAAAGTPSGSSPFGLGFGVSSPGQLPGQLYGAGGAGASDPPTAGPGGNGAPGICIIKSYT